MKIIGSRVDGSLDVEVEFSDGWIHTTLDAAKEIATKEEKTVHILWNDHPIAIASDTDLTLILRQFEAWNVGDPLDEIGPHPDPATTPEFTHGVFVVEL